jgi:hypothetical protein
MASGSTPSAHRRAKTLANEQKAATELAQLAAISKEGKKVITEDSRPKASEVHPDDANISVDFDPVLKENGEWDEEESVVPMQKKSKATKKSCGEPS